MKQDNPDKMSKEELVAAMTEQQKKDGRKTAKGGLEMPEYYENRCCMCPNAGNAKTECPTGPLKYAVTPCRFVKTYRDERGWMYKVMSGIGDDTFKARYQKPEKGGWKGVPKLPWQESFDRAQSDLNAFAKQRGWEELICLD